MKIVAYCGLHYGAEYLGQAAAAVAPFVDEIHLVYTHQPSFGQAAEQANPDSLEALTASVQGLGNQIVWHHGKWGSEGAQHSYIFEQVPADLYVRFDSDEIWGPNLKDCIEEVKQRPEKTYGANFLHFWRAFDRVCVDVWHPTRIHKPQGTGHADLEQSLIYHFGYAQRTAVIQYKLGVSVHKPEFRAGWWENTYLANRQTDIHPVVIENWWTAKPFDKTQLPELLKTHPNYDKAIIE